ncbi:hypothetical protein GKE82_00190 [Conexibacter sp. W3-3-2]|nr:hypothetical protein [Conexibacter sp. W3-3-2]
MPKKIVVGTDGSPTAREAVREAAELAAVTGAELLIVRAYYGKGAPGLRHRVRADARGPQPGGPARRRRPPGRPARRRARRPRGRRGERRRVRHPGRDAAGARGRGGGRHPEDRRRAGGRPDRRRQQGHDRRGALPAGQRAEQDHPPRAVQRARGAHDLRSRSPAAVSGRRSRPPGQSSQSPLVRPLSSTTQPDGAAVMRTGSRPAGVAPVASTARARPARPAATA